MNKNNKFLDFGHFFGRTLARVDPKQQCRVRRTENPDFPIFYAIKLIFRNAFGQLEKGCWYNEIHCAYISMLKEHKVNLLYMHEPFQQDNAPANKALKTTKFFWEIGSTILGNWKI